MAIILDAHALIIFLEREPGFEGVKSEFIKAMEENNNLLMTSVNFGEVYYIVLRRCGQEKAKEIETIIMNLPIEIVDVNQSIAKESAKYKAFKKMSYTNCFVAALAKINNGEILTGDQEFKEIEDEIKILWIN